MRAPEFGLAAIVEPAPGFYTARVDRPRLPRIRPPRLRNVTSVRASNAPIPADMRRDHDLAGQPLMTRTNGGYGAGWPWCWDRSWDAWRAERSVRLAARI